MTVSYTHLEITYGIERLAMYIQKVDSVYDIEWVDGVTYGDVHHQNEVDYSHYNFEVADTDMLFSLFDQYEKECYRVVKDVYKRQLMSRKTYFANWEISRMTVMIKKVSLARFLRINRTKMRDAVASRFSVEQRI